LAPVTIAATTLSRSSVVILVIIGLVCVTLLALFGWHWPLPWSDTGELHIPRSYEIGMWAAMAIGILFSAIFAWRVAAEATRMADALSATEMVLAREQRLSAVGGLAAAAAHELGSPLATISVVARELSREVKDGPLAEDVTLLMSQAERCRDILNRLTREAEASSAHHSAVALLDLLEEITAPHREFGVDIQIDLKDEMRSADTGRGPEVWRRPEILHGLGNIIENAVDFARDHVIVEAVVTAQLIRIRVMDDGPGFSRDVLDRLGEPFTSTRSRLSAPEDGAKDDEEHGMGLGFFIAKTLLERTGAKVIAANLSGTDQRAAAHGAVITMTWPRTELEASPEGLNAQPA
jgi:two-component system sensor histidine kinase RegB